MSARAIATVLLAALELLACGGTGVADPVPTAMEPDRGYVENPTPVAIRGDGFLVRASQPASGGPTTLDVRHRAWLGGTELQDVAWIDVHTLHATVPAGLPPGAHPLVVESPFGRTGRLDAAFTVVAAPGGALQAALAASRSTVTVGQGITLTATVTNIGTAEVTDVAPGAPSVTAAEGASAALASGPIPASIPSLAPGQSGSFSWTFDPSAAGQLGLGVAVSGTDTFSTRAIGAAASPVPVTIQRPPALSVALDATASVAVGADFAVTMTVVNSGEASATGVAPSELGLAPGSVPATLRSGPSPATADVPGGGGAATFSWTYAAASTPGSLRLTGGASGVDSNTRATVSAPASTSGLVTVGRAALGAALAASPAVVSTGQAVTLTLQLTNPGSAPATSVVPGKPTVIGPGQVDAAVAGPVPPTIPSLGPGQTGSFAWAFTARAPGQLGFSASATAVDGFSGALLSAAATLQSAVTVQEPDALRVTTFSASPSTASVGQPVSVTLVLSNQGSATSTVGAVTPSISPPGSGTCTGTTPAPPQVIAVGASTTFAWSCTATAAGGFTLGSTVSATGAGGASVAPTVPGIPITIRAATPLTVSTFSASPVIVNVGQTTSVTLVLGNPGSTAATVSAVTPVAAPPGSATCTPASPSAPQTLAAGASLTFLWRCTATAAGSYALSASVSAADASTGADVSPALTAIPVTAQRPAALVVNAFTASPTAAAKKQLITVTLSLGNTGGANANVSAVQSTITPAAKASCTVPSPAGAQVIAGGASLGFTWTCSGDTARTYTLGGSVLATDANSGASLGLGLPGIAVTVR